jgi:hypothetical protein
MPRKTVKEKAIDCSLKEDDTVAAFHAIEKDKMFCNSAAQKSF